MGIGIEESRPCFLMLSAASSSTPRSAAWEAFLWLAAVVILILAGVISAVLLKRRLRGAPEAHQPSFTLEQLRGLRERGAVTSTEYEALKRSALRGMDEATRAKP